jgi:hypothetical protein
MPMKNLILVLSFLASSFSMANALSVYPTNPPTEKTETRQAKISKIKKRFHKPKFKKSDNTLISAIFWYGFIPLTIAAVIILSFLIPGLTWLWFAGLGLFAIWGGVNGIVFFPLQFAGLPLGMALIIYGLIIKSLLLWTFGLALVFAALFAFSFMVLMFTIGTRKNQPK